MGQGRVQRAGLRTSQSGPGWPLVFGCSSLPEMKGTRPQDAETLASRSTRAWRFNVSTRIGNAVIHRPSPASSASTVCAGSRAPGTGTMRSASSDVAVFALMILSVSPDGSVVSCPVTRPTEKGRNRQRTRSVGTANWRIGLPGTFPSTASLAGRGSSISGLKRSSRAGSVRLREAGRVLGYATIVWGGGGTVITVPLVIRTIRPRSAPVMSR